MADNSARVQFAGQDTIVQNNTKEQATEVTDGDVDSLYSEKGYGVEERDFKKKQIFKGWTLLWLAYQSTGVIYGDIGTSPLYVYSSTFTSAPSHDDILGALSLIIWSLTLIVTVKYVFIVLCADDEGEGGTFAMYTLLSRYSDIMKHDPRINRLVKMGRYNTNEMYRSNVGIRSWLEKSRIAHGLLKALAVFGVSLIMADGILTPAQSVLGAIQGLEVVKPDISSGTIIGATCAILVALFIAQPLGIHKLASGFAPVVIIWLLFNAVFGIYNLAEHDWRVLKAFSPYFAGDWFVRNGTNGWIALGGILLAFTGVEALFADLGAFSKRSVQLSWLCLAYPSLLLAYIGQAAYISVNPEAYSNPFFASVPPGMFWPSLIIAILAAIVASQAIITGTFQLLSQVMHSSYFPQIKVIHKSSLFHGQVYIPIANWLMMIGTVIVTAVYSNTTKLGHAYGVCVILVTFITTNLTTIVAIVVWRLHPAIVFAIWLPFVLLDGLFLSSALTKVPDGAWFTLLLAVILASFFTMWRYGKEKQWASEAKDCKELAHIIEQNPKNDGQRLAARYGGRELSDIKGMGIFFDKAGAFVPVVYEQFLRKFQAQMDVVVLMHMRALSAPYVPEEDRFTVARTSVRNVYRLIIRHGYNDRVITPDLARLVYEEIRKAIIRGAVKPAMSDSSAEQTSSDIEVTKPTFSESEAMDAAITARLAVLDAAYSEQSLYLVGKEQLRITEKHNFVVRTILELFLWVRENSRTKIQRLEVPAEKLVEVGFVGEI